MTEGGGGERGGGGWVAVPHLALRLGVGAYAHKVLDTGEVAAVTRHVERSPSIVVLQVDEVAPLLLDEVLEDVEVAALSSPEHRRPPVLLSHAKRREEKREKRKRRKEEEEDTPKGEGRK